MKNCPTKRAPDVWDSAAFSSIFLASSFFCSRTESQPAHTQVTQTVRCFAEKQNQEQVQRQVLYVRKRRKRTVMENESHESNVFKIENCRAKNGAADLVDCLSPEQAQLCRNSLPFGSGYFCKHPRRNEFTEITKKLRSKLISPPNVSQSDNQ